jgi:hypothetical protein
MFVCDDERRAPVVPKYLRQNVKNINPNNKTEIIAREKRLR